jgi:putative Flp pilus-assembly TadE/G-like protein
MRRRDERGSTTPLIVGFALVLAMAVAMVVDVSAAYLRRQGLDTVADGAALRAADLGATGEEVYGGGVPQGRLDLSADQIRGSVREFLAASGAYAKYPGLSFDIDIDRPSSTVTVHVTAPLDLPLTVPGSPGTATIGATGSAVVVAE